MADIKLKRTARSGVITDGATLATATRAAGDYANATGLDLWCDVYLFVKYSVAPAAGVEVARLWVLPGDGEGTELFPEGGDAGLGTNFDPQDSLLVGSFISINPGTGTEENLCLRHVELSPGKNRFVLKNVSGQTFATTWEIRIVPIKLQSV